MSGGGRSPRDLSVTGALKQTLACMRGDAGVSGRAEVDLDELHSVEEAFAIRFADDLLAIFAAGVPALLQRYRMKLSMVIAHTGELQRRGARGDLVGVGYDERADEFVCVTKSTAETTTLVLFDPDDRSTTRVALLEWLQQRAPAPGPGGPVDEEFAPKLHREMPGTPSGRRARHKKFGEGRILKEDGTGPTRKVQVAFPNIGMKIVQARFLEFLDD